jgi:hypothetical protein
LHAFHLSRKFTQGEVDRMIEQIEQWFAAHPAAAALPNRVLYRPPKHTREDVMARWVSYVENDVVSESIRNSIKRHHQKIGRDANEIES